MYWGYIVRKCDISDFEQEMYLNIWKSGLWESDQKTLLYTVARRAALNQCRRMIWGHRKKFKYHEVGIDLVNTEKEVGKIFDSNWYERMSLQELIDKLDPVKQMVIKSIIKDTNQRDIGKKLKLTESRISQIRAAIIDRLYKLYKLDEQKIEKMANKKLNCGAKQWKHN